MGNFNSRKRKAIKISGQLPCEGNNWHRRDKPGMEPLRYSKDATAEQKAAQFEAYKSYVREFNRRQRLMQ